MVFSIVQGLRRTSARGQTILLAVASSIGAKSIGAVTQLVAYPIAVHALGTARFAAFVMLSSILAWVNISSVGIGPSLTRAITAANAAEDRNGEAEVFGTAIWLALAIAALLIVTAAVALGSGLLDSGALLGTPAAGADGVRALAVASVLVAISVVASATEGARGGYLEQYKTNLWNSAGAAISLGAMLLVAWRFPSVTGMCLAVFGAVAVAKLANTVELIAIGRRYLLPRLKHIRRSIAAGLINSSAAFTLIQLSTLAIVQAPTLIIGWTLSAEAAIPLNVMLNLEALLALGIVMITAPLWPALADAHAKQDRGWIARARRRLMLFTLAYSGAVGLALVLFGREIVHLWLGGKITVGVPLQIAMGLLFPAWMMIHALHTILIGLGRVWQAARILAVWAAISCVAGFLLVPQLGGLGMAIALCGGAAAVLPMLFIASRRAISA